MGEHEKEEKFIIGGNTLFQIYSTKLSHTRGQGERAREGESETESETGKDAVPSSPVAEVDQCRRGQKNDWNRTFSSFGKNFCIIR